MVETHLVFMCVPVHVVSQVHPAVLTMGGDQSRETKAEEREDRREKQQQSAAADSKQAQGSFVSSASVMSQKTQH